MAITITENSRNSLIVNLQTDVNDIKWIPFIFDSTTYEYASSVSVLSAKFVNSVDNFYWDTFHPEASNLSVSAIYSDLTMVTLSAIQSTGDTKAYYFLPRHPYISGSIISDTFINLSASFQSISSNALFGIDNNTLIKWSVSPATGISGSLNMNDFIGDMYALSGYAITASYLSLSSYVADNELYTISLAILNDNQFSLNKDLSGIRSNDNIFFNINPPILLDVLNTSLNSIELSATENNTKINTPVNMSWSISPYSSSTMIAISGVSPLTGLYVPSTVGSSNHLQHLNVTTTDYTKTYTITLSSHAGEYSTEFTPYLDLTNSSVISANDQPMANLNNIRQRSTKIYGISANGVVHNLNPNIYLEWDNTNHQTGINAINKLGNSYDFQSINNASLIDELMLNIITETVSALPSLSTYNFSISALSGLTSDDIIDITTYSFTIPEWVDETYFNPKFIFQYEPEDLYTIYRPLTSANYIITNTSTLPARSSGVINVTFNTGMCSLSFDLLNNLIPTWCEYAFDCLTECVCTVSFEICANAGSSGFITKSAPNKNIIFTTFPKASGFLVFPQYIWDSGTANWVLSNTVNPSQNSTYGFCHTENYYLSAQDETGTGYKWDVENINTGTKVINGTTVIPNTALVPIPSISDTSIYSVSVGIFTNMLSSTMPTMYYDTPTGQMYDNFSNSYLIPENVFLMLGYDVYGIVPQVSSVDTNPFGAPSNLYLTGGLVNGFADTPFNPTIGLFTWQLSSIYWNVRENGIYDNILGLVESKFFINVDEIANTYLGIPKAFVTNIQVCPIINYNLGLIAPHPVNNDWCLGTLTVSGTPYSLNAYPMTPTLYTNNKHIISSYNAKLDNITPMFSAISGFNWTDRNTVRFDSTNSSYITSYEEGKHDLTVETINSFSDISLDFPYILVSTNEYLPYNTDNTRIFGTTKLELPYSLDDCKIAPNEWFAPNFNESMKKLNSNLTYLQNMSKTYDNPPTEHYGWLGTAYYKNNIPVFRWYVNVPNMNYGFNTPNIAVTDDIFTNVKDVCVKNNLMYVSDSTTVYILSSDYKASIIAQRSYKDIGDPFINIAAIHVDNSGLIYLLDSNNGSGSKNRVIILKYDFTNDNWLLQNVFGGLGGVNSKNKFKNPSDMSFDFEENLWIADTDNLCVKKLTKSGSWLRTLTSSEFTETNKPLSVLVDSDHNVHVLCNTNVVRFTMQGEFIDTYGVDSVYPKTLTKCSDDYFLYINCADKIIKVNNIGENIGEIAVNDFDLYTKDYRNSFHDEYRNLYIINKSHMLKYIDKINYIQLNQDIDGKLWNISEILINSEEYNQDWVINKSFQRFYDNLEIFRKSLLGKFDYKTFRTETTQQELVSIDPGDDFDYCTYDFLYEKSKLVQNTKVYEFVEPDIRAFTPTEYQEFTIKKADVFVGINEFVASEVINRCIEKLYDCELILLDLIK